MPRQRSEVSAATKKTRNSRNPPAITTQQRLRESTTPLNAEEEQDLDLNNRDRSESSEDEDDPMEDENEDTKTCLKEAARALSRDKHTQSCSKYLRKLRRQARWIKRLLGPAVDMSDLLLYGPFCLDSDLDANLPDLSLDAFDQESFDNICDEDRQRMGNQYRSLFNIIPSLRTDLEFFAANETRMLRFTSFLSENADAGRRDDVKIIKQGIVELLPDNGENDTPITVQDRSKAERGWYNFATARLLCSRSMLGAFEDNSDTFATEVVEGRRCLRAGDFMTFLYEEDADYDELDVESGFLRNKFLLKVFRYIFTGRASAFSSTPGPSYIGRAPIAVAAKRTTVTPEMIAWTVVMTYFALCSQETWCLRDGGVYLPDLWNEIVEVFEDKESRWVIETLQWWNFHVWGPSSVKADLRFQRHSQTSTAAKLRAQRAARKAARESSTG